ncbi:hypothetical protein CLPUN_43650 [Clostridium puniceum]|uniref:Threonine/Serine exporter ThrE domain-containing protein n=1 Tax=Clostridium puniceum TaxID=29367 RepID=A0A1S8T810_9CLOT|nr:threonine/serine exporter family protein [Clostridium puniceum]OOM73731.1 hypothetical protein CLPUN_43650 [Clostridium puniceum]
MIIKMTILSFLGSVFPVILFNIDRKKIIWCGLAGAIGWIVYSLSLSLTNSEIISSFLGAFAVNIYSEFMARIIKTPASMFYVPGIFPLVPGITAYSTVISVVQTDFTIALNKGILTLAIGGAIAFGIMLSSTIVRLISNIMIKTYLKNN